MAEILPSIVSGMLPCIGQRPAIAGGIKAWLELGKFKPEAPPIGVSASLQIENLEELVRYIAHDFERFSLSSIESFALALSPTEISAVSWPLLKAYYAAFFAAHSIMRCRGAGIVRIEKKHVRKAAELADVYEIDIDQFSGGTYSYKIYETEHGGAAIQWRPASSGSGVHDGFWREFCQFLKDDAAMAVEDALPNASEYVAGTAEISEVIQTADGSGATWISSVRNEINYQHLHDVWLPANKKVTKQNLQKSIKFKNSNTFRLDISRKKHPLECFINISSFLSCLNIELSKNIAVNSTVGRAFGQRYRHVLNSISPAVKFD